MIGIKSRARNGWFMFAALVGTVILAHAAYFDWSDLDVFALTVGLCVASALKCPVPSAAAMAIVLALVIAGHRAPDLSAWPEAERVRTGQSWESVRHTLGTPLYEATTFATARGFNTGHSVPSPIRFRQRGPVAVFVRGEYALWVFHDGQHVVDTFIGGS